DGKSLITSDSPDGDGRDMVIMRLDLASGTKTPLTYARKTSDSDVEPHYSPDGRMIVFRRGLSPYSDLYVMEANGAGVRMLTDLSARIRGFSWTADSRSVIFSSDYEGHAMLYLVDVNSGQMRPLNVGF